MLNRRRSAATRQRSAPTTVTACSLDKRRAGIGAPSPSSSYHHVGPARPGTPPWLTVPGAALRASGGAAAPRGWRTIGSRRGRRLAARRAGRCREGRAPDVRRRVRRPGGGGFPVLERAGFRATVFVPTACLGGGNAWETPGRGAIGCSTRRPSALERRGVEFGAHTRTTPTSASSDRPAIEDEVLGGKRDLEELMQAPVRASPIPTARRTRCPRRSSRARSASRSWHARGSTAPARTRIALRRTMVQAVDTPLDLAAPPAARALTGAARARAAGSRPAAPAGSQLPSSRA